ncbi:hypothetical protein FKM82_009736 [Ascaphus truei]
MWRQTSHVGGRLQQFGDIWDFWVLNLVCRGHYLEFKTIPGRRKFTRSRKSGNKLATQVLTSNMKQLMDDCAIHPVPAQERYRGTYSPMFLIKNKGKLNIQVTKSHNS